MMIAVLDLEKFFKFFIHQHNNGTEGYIHEVVDEETSVKGNHSFVFVHGFDELSCGYPLVLSSVNLQTLFNHFSGCHD